MILLTYAYLCTFWFMHCWNHSNYVFLWFISHPMQRQSPCLFSCSTGVIVYIVACWYSSDFKIKGSRTSSLTQQSYKNTGKIDYIKLYTVSTKISEKILILLYVCSASNPTRKPPMPKSERYFCVPKYGVIIVVRLGGQVVEPHICQCIKLLKIHIFFSFKKLLFKNINKLIV